MSAGPVLRADVVLAEAGARAGSEADDAAPWVEALRRLAPSAAEEGGLHEAGAAAFHEKLVGLAADRLRADALFAAQPEIRERALPVRFVVAGLARSGTTVLHRLLCRDPDVTFLPTWQAFHPVPPTQGADRRRAETVSMIEEMRRTNPDAFTVHPLDADAPEEEVFLLQHSFASMLFMLSCPLPSYGAWLSSADHTGAYRFMLDLLRLEDWHARVPAGTPRVMKSPQFVLDLAVVERCMPDAVIVQTHRDPVELVGSYCSTYAASRRRSCVTVDAEQLGVERLDQLRTSSERALAARDAAERRGDQKRFVDVRYRELVTNAHGVVEQVYDAAGLDVPDSARAAIDAWLAANPQGRDGRHSYDLADYGLDRSRIEQVLHRYIERFRP